MIKFFKQNYSMSLWVTRFLLAATGLFANFLIFEGTAASVSQLYGITESLPRNALAFVVFGVMWAVMVEVAIRLGIKLFIYVSNMHSLPESEMSVLMMGASVVINFLMGLFRLLYLVSPAIYVVFDLAVGFLFSAVVYFLLFQLVKKVYFNEKTSPYMFKYCSLLFLAMALVGVVGVFV